MSQSRIDLAEIRKNPPKTLANAIAIIFKLVEEITRLRVIAFTDGLTKLLTRAPVMDRLSRELKIAQSGIAGKRAPRNTGIESVAVVSIDLIGFKAINDDFGHAAGDGVLTQTAKALTNAVRANDMVARWGGDEFMLVLWNVNAGDVEIMLQRIQASVRTIGNNIDVRIGCVIWSKGPNPVSAQHLIEIADRNERMLHSTGKRGTLVTIYGNE